MTYVGKLLFSIAAIATSVYSMSAFGPGMWSWIFVAVGLVVLISTFLPRLDRLARVLGQVSGALSGLALVLVLLAATVGGSFRMSESNVVFAFMLAGLTVLGLSAFFWKNGVDRNSTDASSRGG